jgi:hypothetical protein
MFPRPREARKGILLAGTAPRTRPPCRGAVGQNGSLAKVLRGSAGLRGCASPPVSLASSAQENGDRSSPAEVPEDAIGALGGQAPRSKKRSPVSPPAGSSWMFGRPSRGQ